MLSAQTDASVRVTVVKGGNLRGGQPEQCSKGQKKNHTRLHANMPPAGADQGKHTQSLFIRSQSISSV